MIDQAEVNKQRWLSVISSKLFWVPAAVGAAVGLLAEAPLAWIGWAAVGFGVASVVWQLTVGGQKLTDQAIAKVKRKAGREHRAYLRRLQRKLRQDRDPRTGEMLRSLRDLYGRVEDLDFDPTQQQTWQIEVYEQIRNLYQSCLSALERSYELWIRANEMATDESRSQMLNWRDDVLNQVSESVQQLGKTVDQVQASAMKRELPDNELSQVRSELEQGLEVARGVEKRIESLEQELQGQRSSIREL